MSALLKLNDTYTKEKKGKILFILLCSLFGWVKSVLALMIQKSFMLTEI